MDWWAIWLIVAGALLILEMFTLTFYLLWLGIGAVVAAVVAIPAPDAIAAQALSGGFAALLLTLYTKPITRRFRQSQGFKDAIDELVGKAGIVQEPIADGAPGIVKIGGETWSAVSKAALHRDEKVRVVRRGTTVLEVEKWED
ncbi:NfeD family protein [Cohnella sp. GCM10027633]|uniref:NfeD family protein n=1 Tax=unclassified Cohnella TaxID=2636738 RepID=UPI003639C5DD